jgi:hypothetical protein
MTDPLVQGGSGLENLVPVQHPDIDASLKLPPPLKGEEMNSEATGE